MYDAQTTVHEAGRVIRFRLTRDGTPLSRGEMIRLLASDAAFRGFFTQLLAASTFGGFRWETPALTRSNSGKPFECVLIDTPEFCRRKTDAAAFAKHFTTDDTNAGIVVFENLGRDATLVVPSPRTDADAYGHLAAFLRGAPERQVDAFWQVAGETVAARVSDRPLWLSTAGGGVAWLHGRIDARPKYYGYAPYRQID